MSQPDEREYDSLALEFAIRHFGYDPDQEDLCIAASVSVKIRELAQEFERFAALRAAQQPRDSEEQLMLEEGIPMEKIARNRVQQPAPPSEEYPTHMSLCTIESGKCTECERLAAQPAPVQAARMRPLQITDESKEVCTCRRPPYVDDECPKSDAWHRAERKGK